MDVVEVLSFLFMLSTMELGMVSNGTMLCQGPCYPFQISGILDRESESDPTSDARRPSGLRSCLATRGNYLTFHYLITDILNNHFNSHHHSGSVPPALRQL